VQRLLSSKQQGSTMQNVTSRKVDDESFDDSKCKIAIHHGC
jgi:hypothetical protein